MHDHSCCVALFFAAVAAISGTVYYFKSQLSAVRRNIEKDNS
ncbi:MAG: hypothetical protein H6Q73_3681 [Firmicutes bacterium]|nr:hypothetical protein [Bacillota bacterium]